MDKRKSKYGTFLYNAIVLLAEETYLTGDEILTEIGMTNADFYDLTGMEIREFIYKQDQGKEEDNNEQCDICDEQGYTGRDAVGQSLVYDNG